MLEIILLIYLGKSIGAIVRSKGRKPLGFQILLVMLWIGGEFFGGVVAGVVHAVRHGDVPFEFGISVYLYALGGAGCGAGFCFLLAYLMPPLDEMAASQSNDFNDPLKYRSPPVDSDNP